MTTVWQSKIWACFIIILMATVCPMGLTLSGVAEAKAVFPGALGFGTETVAGSGRSESPPNTTVYRINTLSGGTIGPTAVGDGSYYASLRAACAASGPRVVIFEVSGTIDITSNIVITNPYITIAGQTAPSPGITLKGAGLLLANTHDVLVQHIRIRVGDAPGGVDYSIRDALGIENTTEDTYNIVIDHCSSSWAIDENVQLWSSNAYPTKVITNVTISNSIISEALDDSFHSKGPHSKGMNIGQGSNYISVLRNLFAHNVDRNPLVKAIPQVMLANNVIYNWGRYGYGQKFTGADDRNFPINANVIGNVAIEGPTTLLYPWDHLAYIFNDIAAGSSFYVSDNICDNYVSDSWQCMAGATNAVTHANSIISSANPAVSLLPANSTESYVLANAGARPADRDSVDLRVVDEVRNRIGRVINSQNEVGAWPQLAQNGRPLSLPGNPNADDDNDGYTNLEEWLHGFAAQVEGVPLPPTGLVILSTN